MSLSGVWRVRFAGSTAILKVGPSPYEAHFYGHVASSLRAAGVPIPILELALHEPDRHWLVIEDIPTPLPVARAEDWQPDPRIIAILAQLHAITRAQPPDIQEQPDRGWTDAMTQATLSCLRKSDASSLAPLLTRLQIASQAVFIPWCWISGDPNPRNWGLRVDGSPVLFDWELFGPGSPATDLAIIVPGLGNSTAYHRVAATYLAAWDHREALPWDAANLTHQIALAKVATVVQLLHGHVTGSAHVSADLLGWLTEAFPSWVTTIHDLTTSASTDGRDGGSS